VDNSATTWISVALRAHECFLARLVAGNVSPQERRRRLEWDINHPRLMEVSRG